MSSECSNSCGEGVKHIKYQCIQRFLKSQQTNPVDSTFCSNIPTPRTMEKCHGTCPDATWSYGDWDMVNYGGTINNCVLSHLNNCVPFFSLLSLSLSSSCFRNRVVVLRPRKLCVR